MHLSTHTQRTRKLARVIPNSKKLKVSYDKLSRLGSKLGRKMRPTRLIKFTRRNPYASAGVAALSLSALLSAAYWVMNKR